MLTLQMEQVTESDLFRAFFSFSVGAEEASATVLASDF
jgi:hypothetical protein